MSCLTYLLYLAWWLVFHWKSVTLLFIPPLAGRSVSQSNGFSLFLRASGRSNLQIFRGTPSLFRASDLDHTTRDHSRFWEHVHGASYIWLAGEFLESSFIPLIYSFGNLLLPVYSVLNSALGTVDSINSDMEMKLSSMSYICQALLLRTFQRFCFIFIHEVPIVISILQDRK